MCVSPVGFGYVSKEMQHLRGLYVHKTNDIDTEDFPPCKALEEVPLDPRLAREDSRREVLELKHKELENLGQFAPKRCKSNLQ